MKVFITSPFGSRLQQTLATALLGALLLPALPLAARSDPLPSAIGVNRGICAIVGKDAKATALDLARQTELTIYVQTPDESAALRLRKAAENAGLLGSRIHVETGPSDRLHLAGNLADAIVVAGETETPVPLGPSALTRALHSRGRLILGDQIWTKPVLVGEGDWSHPYHGPDNNPQSSDTLAVGPYLTKFLAKPWYGPMPEVTVSAGGRMFKAFGHISFKKREWALLNTLAAFNAHNGTLLWKRDLLPGFMIHRNTLVATDDTLFLADNDSCKLLDAATGELRREIRFASHPAWKWMVLDGGVLYALLGDKEPIDDTLQGVREKSGWPWTELGKMYDRKNEYQWGFGNRLVALDPATGETLWTRNYDRPIDSRGMAMKGRRIFLYSHKNHLEAVNASDGSPDWKTSDPKLLQAIGEHAGAQNPKLGYSSTVYLKAGPEVLYFAGPQRTNLVAVSASDGKLLWSYPHGNYQLVIRDDALYAMGRTDTSRKFDPLSGKILAELDCFRGNCTRATGTADAIFARGHSHAGTLRMTLSDDAPHRMPAMRPGCQDGVIAANGQLYWGPWMCDCNHSLVGIISLGPAGKFDFEQPAKEAQRLKRSHPVFTRRVAFKATQQDWPTYRKNNQRTAHTTVNVPTKPRLAWNRPSPTGAKPTAPIAVGDTLFLGGDDGAVRALNARTGEPRWTAYTGGRVYYPPTLADSIVLAGSGDGHVYAFDAGSGRELWRFRAAPIERRIPVYGKLVSNWPVASGVMVEDGVAYAAAGIVSHDGTHVYALDARTGALKWQNNTSGRLLENEGEVSGVSVQGHLLWHDDKIHLAGGNMVSPAVYDAKTGACLNTITNLWETKAPRGSELFLADGQVRVIDSMIYAPREYIPSRYHAKYLLQSADAGRVIQGTQNEIMCLELGNPDTALPNKLLWKQQPLLDTTAVVLCGNGILVAGMRTPEAPNPADQPKPVLQFLDQQDGRVLWALDLPAPTTNWGLAVTRNGSIVATLGDGRVLCWK